MISSLNLAHIRPQHYLATAGVTQPNALTFAVNAGNSMRIKSASANTKPSMKQQMQQLAQLLLPSSRVINASLNAEGKLLMKGFFN